MGDCDIELEGKRFKKEEFCYYPFKLTFASSTNFFPPNAMCEPPPPKIIWLLTGLYTEIAILSVVAE
jgi:hypothetical protein